MNLRFFVLLFVSGFIFALEAASPEDIREAVKREYAAGETAVNADSLSSALDAEGRWADIDYTDGSTSLWQLEKHLDRMVDIAKVYRLKGAGDEKLLKALNRALDQWFDGNYKNANWWYTKIGVPRRMLALAYLLDENLTAEHGKKINASLDAIDSEDFPARPGGDRIQVLSNHAKVLLWRRDFEGVGDIFKKIENEARFAPNEAVMYDAGGGPAVRNGWQPSGRGVQRDMSFHHRGDRVDSTLTYGMELPEFFAYWAELLKDSQWEFTDESIHFIIDYYLDGVCRHLVAGRYAEPTIMNRELSRPGAGVFDSEIARKLYDLSGGYRSAELADAIEGLDGCKHVNGTYAADFEESDYFVFSRPKFQTAVRYHSLRNANQEAPHNREGIRNHFRGNGANMLSVTGREYADIAPVFDFRMIPGATTPMIPYEPLSDWGDVAVLNSPVTFAGAVADSVYGAVAYDFASMRTDLQARKGYFFFDDGYVCLGSGINSSSPYEIVTTVEQTYSDPSGFLKEGDDYIHKGNLYRILEGNHEGKTEHRKGKWSNAVENVEYADSEKEADIFTLLINHGIRPTDGSYAYYIVPGVKDAGEPSFEIIANNDSIQAVESKDGDVVYVIFYEPGEIDTKAGRFGSNRRCLIMIRDKKYLFVSDPSREGGVMTLLTPKGEKSVVSGQGAEGGETIRIEL